MLGYYGNDYKGREGDSQGRWSNLHYTFASMLKRLKTELFMSEVEKQLERAKINKSHEFVHPKHLTQLLALLQVPKSRNDLLNCLYKRLHSSDATLKLKALIVLHACIRKSFEEDICEVVMNLEVESVSGAQKEGKGNIEGYVRAHAINFYLVYLKKMCMHRESYSFVKRFAKKEMETEYTYRNELKHEENLEIVNHGFKILNLCNYILQSQEMFNKMGRYHIEHEEILSMYMQLLDDLNHFNNYVKLSVRVILDRHNQSRLSMADCKLDYPIDLGAISVKRPHSKATGKKEKMATSATQAETSSIALHEEMGQYSEEQAEEMKHEFLYVYECQKVSDRLYEYYHNRYYYKILRNMIIFPTFLTVDNKEYSKMRNRTKRVDRDLVNLVKRSKYDGETSLLGSIRTEPSLKPNDTFSYSREKGNLTENDDYSMRKDPYRNISYNFIPSKMEETLEEVGDDY